MPQGQVGGESSEKAQAQKSPGLGGQFRKDIFGSIAFTMTVTGRRQGPGTSRQDCGERSMARTSAGSRAAGDVGRTRSARVCEVPSAASPLLSVAAVARV